jgi:anti-sigma regulatory factor (Ser/Thr protein kinase)
VVPTHRSFHLNRRPQEAQTARRHVAAMCPHVDPDIVSTAQLLTSELFTNALDHSRGSITLSVVLDDCALRVEVTDHAEGSPIVREVDLQDEHGRGMLLVATLASDWGAGRYPSGNGKYVWFTLRTATAC